MPALHEAISPEPALLQPGGTKAERAPKADAADGMQDGHHSRDPPTRDFSSGLADAARVWDVYRDEATQSDNHMLNGWNKTLDILLIFAGVFSAVATTFIVESNDQLRPDWNEYTARLLYAVLADPLGPGIGNRTLAFVPDPDTFAALPASAASRWISGLWVFSLAISLVVSLFCILAKQWLIEYHARVFGSVRSAQQWCRRRTLFFTGIEQWRLPLLLATLPAALHLSLFLFGVGLVLFFWKIHHAVATSLLITTSGIFLFYCGSCLITFYDVSCPFYTPLFHRWHFVLAHINHRTGSFAQYVSHVVDAIKLRLDTAMLAWLSATSSEQDILEIAVSATIARFTSSAPSVDPQERFPHQSHMLQLLEALRAVDCSQHVPDPRMDTALIIFDLTLKGAKMDELTLRKHVDALCDLCSGYQGRSGAATHLPLPSSITDARYDAIALLSHIAANASYYSLTKLAVLTSAMSRIWSPNLIGDDLLTSNSHELFEMSPGNVVDPLSVFVASPTFFAAPWTEEDIAIISDIFMHPLLDAGTGGKALLNLLHVAVMGHATFSSVFAVVECIRINAAAGIYILSSSTDQFHLWRQLCCTLDAPAMEAEHRNILAPLLIECAIALGMEIWRQHAFTESAARLTRELLDARCMAPILRGPFLVPHRRECLSYRSRTTGKHSAEHLFLNVMPFLLPGAWHTTWEDILDCAQTNELTGGAAAVLHSIDVRLRSARPYGHTEVGLPSTVQFTSEVFPPRIRVARLEM